jgi:hypothetical protein
MLVVVKVSYDEFHQMVQNILSSVYKDYYADVTWRTLTSSPLTPFILMLCPIVIYITDSHFNSVLIPLSLLEINRIHTFILIHRVLNTSETNFKFTYSVTDQSEKGFKKIEKVSNPILSAVVKDTPVEEKNKDVKLNDDFSSRSTLASKPSKSEENQLISLNMFNSCLHIIVLDAWFFFI